GANDGIGKEIAIDLAKRNATVIIGCRESEKSKQALQDIRLLSGSDKVILGFVELSSLQSIKDFATTFIATQNELHLLINNAGVYTSTRQETGDGFESNFGINYLAPFLLTELLLPILAASKPSRVVNVGSSIMQWATINFDDLQLERKFSVVTAYSQSKFANALNTYYLSRKFSDKGITFNVCHPGTVRTTIMTRESEWSNIIPTMILSLFFPFTKSPIQGAQTVLYLATAPEVEEKSGLYWSNCAVSPQVNKLESDEALQDKLYDISRILVKDYI
ncbi:retinol dehydrogenase 12, partial [Phycomyces nitens]